MGQVPKIPIGPMGLEFQVVPKLGIWLSQRFLSRPGIPGTVPVPSVPRESVPIPVSSPGICVPGQKFHGIPVPSLNKVYQKRNIENHFNWIKAYNQTWCIEQGCPIHPITVPRYVSYLCSLLSIIMIIKKKKIPKKNFQREFIDLAKFIFSYNQFINKLVCLENPDKVTKIFWFPWLYSRRIFVGTRTTLYRNLLSKNFQQTSGRGK